MNIVSLIYKGKPLLGAFLRVFFPLWLGGMIYLLFGSEEIRLVSWLMDWDSCANIRQTASEYLPPAWIRFNLPDGLWLFSLLQFVAIIWKDESPHRIWADGCVLMAVVHEFCQMTGHVSGTFDGMDLCFYSVGGIASFFISKFM